MKNLMVQKGLVCMTQAEFERLQAYLEAAEARLTTAMGLLTDMHVIEGQPRAWWERRTAFLEDVES